jgi:hypothetical protein
MCRQGRFELFIHTPSCFNVKLSSEKYIIGKNGLIVESWHVTDNLFSNMAMSRYIWQQWAWCYCITGSTVGMSLLIVQ